MTPQEFKRRWESNEEGDGITFDDIARCAINWGLYSTPRTQQISVVTYAVLRRAKVVDAEEYKPSED